MRSPYVTRHVAYMDLQPSRTGDRLPTLWDTDDRRDGEPRVRVGVEVQCDGDGTPCGFNVSSDDNHVMFCEQNPGPEDIE